MIDPSVNIRMHLGYTCINSVRKGAIPHCSERNAAYPSAHVRPGMSGQHGGAYWPLMRTRTVLVDLQVDDAV